MDTRREVIFGRLFAIANLLGRSVFEDTPFPRKGGRSIQGLYLDRFKKKPFETFVKIHQELMDHSHKFGDHELVLMDLMGEMVNELTPEDVDNDTPLKDNFLLPYYKQNHELRSMGWIMGTQEASELWGYTSQDHVKRLCREGKVKCVQIGNTWILDRYQPNPRKIKS